MDMKQPRETKNNLIHEMYIPINVDVEKLNEAITKAKELVSLLREANELTNSLSGGQC